MYWNAEERARSLKAVRVTLRLNPAEAETIRQAANHGIERSWRHVSIGAFIREAAFAAAREVLKSDKSFAAAKTSDDAPAQGQTKRSSEKSDRRGPAAKVRQRVRR